MKQSKLLKKYEEASDHIKVEKERSCCQSQVYFRVYRRRGFPNSLIVECGERSKVVD